MNPRCDYTYHSIIPVPPMSNLPETIPETLTKFINVIRGLDPEPHGSKIILLREPEVLQWLFGDLSFLPLLPLTEEKTKKKDDGEYKQKIEKEWGQNMLEKRRPDLKKHGQWTTKLGEHITEEFMILMGKTPTKPVIIDGYSPDVEVEDAMWEAKAQTYYTPGTAGEKILGVPMKYADVPELYNKPLKILCIGCAEKLCREKYGNLCSVRTTAKKQKFIDFYKENGIEWVGATELIRQIVNNTA